MQGVHAPCWLCTSIPSNYIRDVYLVSSSTSSTGSASVGCPSGKIPLGGGCVCGGTSVASSYPTASGWSCGCYSTKGTTAKAYALCGTGMITIPL